MLNTYKPLCYKSAQWLNEGSTSMQGEAKERWHMLCEQAAIEQDHQKLMLLIKEISDLLEEKEKRLRRSQTQSNSAA